MRQKFGDKKMQNLKKEAIEAISKMPDFVDIDEIMYRLYVIDKIIKGRKAAEKGELTSVDDLKKEVETW
jgi:hypothetical protein